MESHHVGLTVSICSFGYHRSGIPDDPYGNGGGFVFDCRALPNPGREVRFAHLSGLDEEVRMYLEQHELVWKFLGSVYTLLDEIVARYREYGYDELHVAFGCTGGQHRSVYCAETLAGHLREQGVEVEVLHTEKGLWW